jgi:hypothetical protein
VALGQKITPETVGDLAGIDAIVLPLGCRIARSISGCATFTLLGAGKQMIINLAGEDRRFHGDHARLRQRPDPSVQLAPGRADLAFSVYTTSRVLDAIADRLLRN